ncbi:hypothetical protein MNBD_GAMMA16-1767 [hydrothermal vent metagenome]|uniref:Outer membrane protein n=1 Tax=hydrothermal vent metagenome TaxID=652676 RepID=A0A3B0YSS4_9ZZZZ
MLKLLFLFLFITFSSYSGAEKKLPKWEAGLWAGGLIIPDYRGSSETQYYVLPLPYFIYRSERFQVSGKEAKGLLYKSKNIQINLSGRVNLPVDSDENAARAGMSDIDTALLMGSTLHYKLYQKENNKLSFRFPLQAVFSTDFSRINHRGFTFSPSIFMNRKAQWNSSFSLAFLFSTQLYNEYYYGVSENNVRLGRAYYQPNGGYGGIRMTLDMKRKLKKYNVGGFVLYDNLSRATYETSPLVTKPENFTVGIYFTYQFAKSKQLVRSSFEAPDE